MDESKKSIPEMVAQLDKVVVCHPDWKAAYDGILGCIEKTKYYRESENCMLLGNAGVGKSQMCQVILSNMPSYCREDETGIQKIVPAFLFEVPSPATIKTCASVMLKKLGDPNPYAGSGPQLTERLLDLFDMCQVQVVLLDELHNIFDLTNASKPMNVIVCSWLKGLINKSRSSLCLVGLPGIYDTINSGRKKDSELARRLKTRFDLRPLTLPEGKKSGTLRPFLAEIERKVEAIYSVRGLEFLRSQEGVVQIYAATEGNPSAVMAVIKEALTKCLERRDSLILPLDFEQVCDTSIISSTRLVAENPFRLSREQIIMAMRGTK